MNYSIKQKLGLIIKNNRKIHNLSQSNLAERINYNQSVVSKAEQGFDKIPLPLYIQLLKEFSFDYEVNVELNQKMDDLIDLLFDSIITFKEIDIQEIDRKIDTLHKINRDVIRYYDLLILEFIVSFYKKLFLDCKTFIDLLIDIYPITHPKCQFIFFYVNNYLALFHNIGKVLPIPKQVALIGEDIGISQYLNGWINLHEFNYSKALTEFYYASKQFKKTGNVCRSILAEKYINEILLMDKHFFDVVERTQDFISLFKECSKVTNSLDHLYYQLGYAYFYLKKYKEAHQAINYIKYDDAFTAYLRFRIDEKLGNDITQFLNLKDSKFTALINLYFKDKNKDQSYYKMIENYILPDIDKQITKLEYQHYIKELLDYYWSNKKYSKYKKLMNQFFRVLHIE